MFAGSSHHRSAQPRWWLLAVAVLGACAPGDSSRARALPPPPAHVDVSLVEYDFEHPAELPGGRVVFAVRNAGVMEHELVLVALPDDFPPLQEQLRGHERRGVDTVAALHGRAPGSLGTFAAELAPGRYGLICFVTDVDGVPHSLKGMTSEFRVL